MSRADCVCPGSCPLSFQTKDYNRQTPGVLRKVSHFSITGKLLETMTNKA